jgi:hypothetical protein
LSKVDFSSIGGGDSILLSTDCIVVEEGVEDTAITVVVLDENGNEIDRFEDFQADPTSEETLMIDATRIWLVFLQTGYQWRHFVCR